MPCVVEDTAAGRLASSTDEQVASLKSKQVCRVQENERGNGKGIDTGQTRDEASASATAGAVADDDDDWLPVVINRIASFEAEQVDADVLRWHTAHSTDAPDQTHDVLDRIAASWQPPTKWKWLSWNHIEKPHRALAGMKNVDIEAQAAHSTLPSLVQRNALP